MRLEKLALVLVGICLVTGLARSSATGQVNSERRMTALRSRVNQLKTYFDRIPARQRQFLSGGALNVMKLAENWDRLEASLKKSALHKPTPGPLTAPGPLITDGRRVVPVSDPATDFSFSVMGGFTQSETSTAWCGPNAVVGFNDTGSILESLLFGPGGVSISGVAYSSDQGASFNDAGFVNPGSNPANLLLGGPVVTCAS